MEFVVRQMRMRGQPVDRGGLGRQRAHRGELLVVEFRDERLGRTIRQAVLRDAGHGRSGEILPSLREPQLLWMGPQGLVIMGYERLPDGADVIQGWWVQSP